MRLGPQAAPWLPHFISILKANRPPRFKLGTVALLFGELDRLYLAIIWRGATVQTPLLEFHSIKRVDNNRRRLNYLRSFQDWSISLAPPTGLRIFAGEAPIAVVDLSSGGSAAAGNRLRLIQMKRNTVDITPDWAGRVVDVVDLNGDGQYEIVTMDGRWAGYFDGRGAAGPHLPIVLSRSKENFVPACREYATAYRGWIERYVRYVENPDHPTTWRAEAFATVLLAYAQIGSFANARKTLTAIEALYRKGDTVLPGLSAKVVFREFSDVIVQSERYRNSQCPASAADSKGGHYGTIARIESFRMPSK